MGRKNQQNQHDIQFLTELLLLLKLNMPLDDALKFLQQAQDQPRLSQFVNPIQHAVASQSRFSSALSKQAHWPDFLRQLLLNYEQEHDLITGLEKILHYRQQIEANNRQFMQRLRAQWAYSLLLFLLCIFIASLLMNSALPTWTPVLFDASLWIKNNLKIITLTLLAVVLYYLYGCRNQGTAFWLARWWANFQLFLPTGKIQRDEQLIRALYTWQLACHQSLPEIFSALQAATHNAAYAWLFAQIKHQLQQGHDLSQILPCYPRLLPAKFRAFLLLQTQQPNSDVLTPLIHIYRQPCELNIFCR